MSDEPVNLTDRVRLYVLSMPEPHRNHFGVYGGTGFVAVDFDDGEGGGELIHSDYGETIAWINEMASTTRTI